MFTQAQYTAIKAKLNFERQYAVTLGLIAFDAALIGGAVKLLQMPGWGAYVASQVLLALVFFHGFALLHEAGHGNVSSSRTLNHLTGLYASILCCMPFFPWVYIHQQHHVWVGNVDRDPTAANLKRWREKGSLPWLLKAAWRTWIPLGALAQHVVFLTYPLKIRGDKSKLWPSVGSVLLILSSYWALCHWVPSFMQLRSFALSVPLYLCAEELVNFPHHSDLHHFSARLPLWDQWKASRSCHYPWLVSELLWLNFNYHTEHHLYPSLPWYRLRGARQNVKAALKSDYHESIGITWNLERRRQDIEKLLL
jgi:fatty acid desaturase